MACDTLHIEDAADDKGPMFAFSGGSKFETMAMNGAIRRFSAEIKEKRDPSIAMLFHQCGSDQPAGYQAWEIWRKDPEATAEDFFHLLPKIDAYYVEEKERVRQMYSCDAEMWAKMNEPVEPDMHEQKCIANYTELAQTQRALLAEKAPKQQNGPER